MKKFTKPSVISCGQKISVPSHGNYGKFILEKLLQSKDKVALINGELGTQVTYGEMAQQIVNVASSLVELGVGAKDVVGVCSENRVEFLISALAGMCTEAVVTFINSAYSNDELVHTLGISRPKYLFLSPNTYKSYYKTIRSLYFIETIFIFGSSVSGVKSFEEMAARHININSFQLKDYNGVEKTALILYSSGTTGLPKGAKLSHRNLIISGLQPLTFRRNLICLSLAPWTNTVGIILTLDELIYNETVVFLPRFNEETYLKCIEKYKVGILLTVPPMIVLLNKSKLLERFDVSSVELMYCGGAPLSSSAINEAKTRFPNLQHVLQGYGMTEASGGITEDNDEMARQGSVGKVVEGLTVKIVDIDTRELLGPNMPGEVCLRGSALFQGYIGRELSEDLDNEGFYCTGDVAYYDEDGYFFIVDRIKELIKYKAGQVAPSELEAILRQHPAVKDAGVVGAPDPLVGELPTAFIVKTPDVMVSEKELIDFVGSKVSSWKQLRGGIRFVKEIPKNGSGKILRRKLREMLTMPVKSNL